MINHECIRITFFQGKPCRETLEKFACIISSVNMLMSIMMPNSIDTYSKVCNRDNQSRGW
jgi:hypothetical protein